MGVFFSGGRRWRGTNGRKKRRKGCAMYDNVCAWRMTANNERSMGIYEGRRGDDRLCLCLRLCQTIQAKQEAAASSRSKQDRGCEREMLRNMSVHAQWLTKIYSRTRTYFQRKTHNHTQPQAQPTSDIPPKHAPHSSWTTCRYIHPPHHKKCHSLLKNKHMPK